MPTFFLQVLPLVDDIHTKLREFSFNSPGDLTGTPCDTTRRYEYPYPPPDEDELLPVMGLQMDFLPTPSLSPEVEPPDPFSRYAINMAMAPPVPAPVPVLGPTPIALVATKAPVLAVSSRLLPAHGAIAHPKLAHFNPADVPIPPSLRERIARMSGLFPSLSSDSKLHVDKVADIDISMTMPVETPTTPRAAWL